MVCLSCRVIIPNDGWELCEKCYSSATGINRSGKLDSKPEPDTEAYIRCVTCDHPKFRHVKEECIAEDEELGLCPCKKWVGDYVQKPTGQVALLQSPQQPNS